MAALPRGAGLPPGFAGPDTARQGCEPDASQPGDPGPRTDARPGAALRARGLLTRHGEVDPCVAADLRRLAAPEVTVLVTAARPGLEVSAAVAVQGPLGAALLRTGGDAVELSAFAAGALAAELARLVPAPLGRPPLDGPVRVPLPDLLAPDAGGPTAGLRARWGGALRATVLGPSARRPAPAGGQAAEPLAGVVDWVWLRGPAGAGGWAALEPAAARPGTDAPEAGVVPVQPGDLGTAVAPFVGLVLAAAG